MLRAKELGAAGEQAAAQFLATKGMTIVERGYRNRIGEIDIIARDRGSLVFVEVKSRSGLGYGHPSEAVTPAKQRQILRMAECYLQQTKQWDSPCRFDVVEVLLDAAQRLTVRHIPNAFIS